MTTVARIPDHLLSALTDPLPMINRAKLAIFEWAPRSPPSQNEGIHKILVSATSLKDMWFRMVEGVLILSEDRW